MELITERGYDKVTIEQICKKAGVSVGAFYHHFSSKEGIFVHGYQQTDLLFAEQLQGRFRSSNAIDRIVELIDFQIEIAASYNIDMLIQIYKAQINAANRFLLSEQRTLPRILTHIIAEGQERGEVATSMRPEEMCTFILRFSRGIIYDWCVHNGDYDLPQVAHDALQHLLPVLRPPR